MSSAHRFAYAMLGITVGASAGAVVGLLAGLAHIEIAGTSGFEGYSGFVVAFWLLSGVMIGMVAGVLIAYKFVTKR